MTLADCVGVLDAARIKRRRIHTCREDRLICIAVVSKLVDLILGAIIEDYFYSEPVRTGLHPILLNIIVAPAVACLIACEVE